VSWATPPVKGAYRPTTPSTLYVLNGHNLWRNPPITTEVIGVEDIEGMGLLRHLVVGGLQKAYLCRALDALKRELCRRDCTDTGCSFL
jgi:hypothetical protein